jgi:hypothetical protein
MSSSSSYGSSRAAMSSSSLYSNRSGRISRLAAQASVSRACVRQPQDK